MARIERRQVAKKKAAYLRKALVSLASALFIVACASSGNSGGGNTGGTGSAGGGSTGGTGGTTGGGGTSGGTGSGGGTALLPSESFRTTEYRRTWALEAIHAAEAYALGYTGEGVTIGVVDFNFDLSSIEVNYLGASVGADSQAIAWYEAVIGAGSASELHHGHAVAATAAALKNDDEIHGVAFNADVLGVDFFANVNTREVVQGGITVHYSDPWTYLTSRGVKIINKSFGFDDGDGVGVPGSATDFYTNEAAVIAIANGALLVASAGNNGEGAGGFEPILSNREIVDDIVANNLEGGPGAFMMVGSVRQSISGFEISDFSNRAGSYEDYFIVAPGEGVTFPFDAPECAPSFVCLGNGTSLSAPLVSGAAALVLERWPQLTAKEITDILFESATDLGAPGPDPIYGQGMLDVFAALQPLGVTTLSVQGGVPFSTENSGIILGEPFGDAPQLRVALQAVPIRDSFSRDFGIDLSGFVRSAPGSNLVGIMEQKSRWHGAAYRLGFTSGVSVQLYDEQKIPFQVLNGLEEPDGYRGVVQLTGQSGTIAWTAGSGLALSTALGNESNDAGVAPLTRAFSNMLEARTGLFATGRIALSERANLSFGMSHAPDTNDISNYLPGLSKPIGLSAAAFRLGYAAPLSDLSFEMGSALEEGAILGTTGVGALNLAERSSSVWTRFSGKKSLSLNWSFKESTSLALTKPDGSAGNLVAAFAPIVSSANSFGVARSNLFSRGDALSLTLHQPLRVERATMTFFAAGNDPGSGAASVTRRDISLTPSGREIALELGYNGTLGPWNAQANIAYRHDSGHVAGEKSGAAMLWLSRWF